MMSSIRRFFTPGSTLTVKRRGKQPYSGVVREVTFFGGSTVVWLDMPRKLKGVNPLLPGNYTIGGRTVEVPRGVGTQMSPNPRRPA
jgi:hypothetical protein